MSRRVLGADNLVPLGLVALAAVVATLGFRGVFDGWGFVSAAIIGAAGAAGVAVLARWARLVVTESILVSLIGFVVLGAVATGGVPTPDAFGMFFDGIVNGWAQLLSSSPPADLTPEFRVLPYTIAWCATLIGAELLRSTRLPGLAILGPVLGLTVSMLFTLEDRRVALAQGAALAVIALALTVTHQAFRAPATQRSAVPARRRVRAGALGLMAATMAIVGLAAPVVGPRLPLADANDRFDLRQFQAPPFDPLREPSPLVQLKASLQEENAGEIVFRVMSDDQLARFPLAIHNTYDGVVWNVADPEGDAPAEFRPVDSVLPAPSNGDIDQWATATATVEIVDLGHLAHGEFDPVWLPTAGWPVSLRSESELDLRFNTGTGTLALPPEGPADGLVYDLVVALPPESDDVGLGAATVAVDTSSTTGLVTPQLRSFAAEVFEGADRGLGQVLALQRTMTAAYYDARPASTTARPGHSLFRLAEFLDDREVITGFEEQFAATAAVVAQNNEIPARVVVGYRIPDQELDTRWSSGTLDVTAGDISAWIEVRFDELGWVPFDVTPDRDRTSELQEQNSGVTERRVAIPNPPPPPPTPQLPPHVDDNEEFDEEEDEEEDDDDGAGSQGSLPVRTILVGSAIASPFVFAIGGASLVAFWKGRRTLRRRRRGSASRRVAGAWYETADRLREIGVRTPSTATPRELAHGLLGTAAVDETARTALLGLADAVDATTYHPDPAPEDRAEVAWQQADVVVRTVRQGQGRLRRLVAAIDPRPLFRSDPLAYDEPEEVVS